MNICLTIAAFCLMPEMAPLSTGQSYDTLRLLFYNTENLFDCQDDSLTADDEFTPEGSRHWTGHRYRRKLVSIYKVIVSAGGWTPPVIIGLCEIENRRVTGDLIDRTPLSRYPYGCIHHESPDERGIDVALLYHREWFRVVQDEKHPVPLETGHEGTRDILSVTGILGGTDTLTLFVTHWPSRWEGVAATEPARTSAARVLKSLVDSLHRLAPARRIIIMGDLNDEPSDPSLRKVLGVKELSGPVSTSGISTEALYLLGHHPYGGIFGTSRYRGTWYDFDHIIVSGILLEGRGTCLATPSKGVHHPDFLLQRDGTYGGLKPFRTYNGYRYQGGYSDHLPVYIDLIVPSGD